MRNYGNNIEHSRITGFPSACAEFAEKTLSLDEHFNMGGPNKIIHVIQNSFPFFKIEKGDLLHIDLAMPVKPGMLVLVSVDEEVGIFKYTVQGLVPRRLTAEQVENAVVYAITGMSRPIAL